MMFNIYVRYHVATCSIILLQKGEQCIWTRNISGIIYFQYQCYYAKLILLQMDICSLFSFWGTLCRYVSLLGCFQHNFLEDGCFGGI